MCGSTLLDHIEEGQDRPRCPNCGFVHYHNPAPAAGCVVFKNGKLLMVQRAHEPYVGAWTMPAGFLEWDEGPAQTAVRELKEETNLDVSITGLFNVYNGDDDPRTNAIMVLYFADILGGELRADDDAGEARFFAESEIPKNIAFESHRQAIRDLKQNYSHKFKADAD
jgi:ADP-ribose pyrophosphatase YjhB (NUDIX family)